MIMGLAPFALVLAACGGGGSGAQNPLRCESDPNCRAHQKEFDCSSQCTDDPSCVDRCRQIEEQTGTQAPR